MVVIFHRYVNVNVYQRVTYSWDIPESYSWFPLSSDIPKNHGSYCHGHLFGDIPDPPVGYELHPTAGRESIPTQPLISILINSPKSLQFPVLTYTYLTMTSTCHSCQFPNAWRILALLNGHPKKKHNTFQHAIGKGSATQVYRYQPQIVSGTCHVE